MEWRANYLNTVDWEWYIDLLEQIFSVIIMAGRDCLQAMGYILLIHAYLRKGTGRTLLTTGISPYLVLYIGKVCCKILSNRLVQSLDKEGALHEGQAGFRINSSCMDNVLKLCKAIKHNVFFLDMQKVYDSVWRDSL